MIRIDAWRLTAPFGRARVAVHRHYAIAAAAPDDLAWSTLPGGAQLYVATVIVIGACAFVITSVPLPNSRPVLFASLLIAAGLTSVWKVNLPIPLASGSTLSVSYAADLAALLLLGPPHAVVVAVAGAWMQCTFNVKRRYPVYRTVFSTATAAITMVATSLMYARLGGTQAPFDVSVLPRPVVGAIAMYFALNTGLVAGAIALSTGRPFAQVWRDDFLWSAASFLAAGSAGVAAAVVLDRGEVWKAVLLLGPVYLTYRTYLVFVGRLEDQRRHAAETERLHQEAVRSLVHAREAEHALANERGRLAAALVEMSRLEQVRKHLFERERAARAIAEQANRLKDEFLALVSHELRTPLNAILGWADMLRNGSVAEMRRDRALEAIYDNAKRQAQLVDDLLDVSRIISGKLRLERTAVDLNDVVRGALEVVLPAANAKRIDIAVAADRSIGAFHGDGTRLQQIVWNLLTNAIKFTPDGGAVHVRLRRADDGFVELVVSDTGQGIPRDFLPSVFEAFRQGDGSTTRRHGGLGLGLSIVKHLVDAHGGSIRANSEGEGRGATFTVRLPFVPADADTPAAEAAGPPPQSLETHEPSASLKGLSVLIVDDDEACREVTAAHLESHGAAVLMAASAARALELLRRQPVDVVLADVAMPGEDGYELIRKLRVLNGSRAAPIPAAALTAFARDEDRQRVLEAGFQLHLAKPIDARSLVEAVVSLRRLNPA